MDFVTVTPSTTGFETVFKRNILFIQSSESLLSEAGNSAHTATSSLTTDDIDSTSSQKVASFDNDDFFQDTSTCITAKIAVSAIFSALNNGADIATAQSAGETILVNDAKSKYSRRMWNQKQKAVAAARQAAIIATTKASLGCDQQNVTDTVGKIISKACKTTPIKSSRTMKASVSSIAFEKISKLMSSIMVPYQKSVTTQYVQGWQKMVAKREKKKLLKKSKKLRQNNVVPCTGASELVTSKSNIITKSLVAFGKIKVSGKAWLDRSKSQTALPTCYE